MQLAKSIIIAFLAATATTFAAPVPAPEANTDATLPTGGQLVMGIIVDEVNDADNSKIIAFPGGRGRPRRPYPGDPTKRTLNVEKEGNINADMDKVSKLLVLPNSSG
ncbi:hypothetical protein EC991_002769 [Linnemannia zychae]|nr:hypothetical protein EC991_002769 [Linnemannia zychae]